MKMILKKIINVYNVLIFLPAAYFVYLSFVEHGQLMGLIFALFFILCFCMKIMIDVHDEQIKHLNLVINRMQISEITDLCNETKELISTQEQQQQKRSGLVHRTLRDT